MVAAVPLDFPVPAGLTPALLRQLEQAADRWPRETDQRFAMFGVSWDQYVAINDAFGDRPGVRVCYCEGTLELMSPGWLHEGKKTMIARLLELYALARDVPLEGYGSMTYRRKAKDRAVEPDECYFLGKATSGPPDIAIEIAVSRSAIDKQSLYAGLEVRELWIWQADRIAIFHLGKAGYREVKRSKVLPTLDIDELSAFARMPDQTAAAKAYWKRLQEPPRASKRSRAASK